MPTFIWLRQSLQSNRGDEMKPLNLIYELLTPTIKIELLYLLDGKDFSLEELKRLFWRRELLVYQALWQLKNGHLVKCEQQEIIIYCLTKKGQELVDLLKLLTESLVNKKC